MQCGCGSGLGELKLGGPTLDCPVKGWEKVFVGSELGSSLEPLIEARRCHLGGATLKNGSGFFGRLCGVLTWGSGGIMRCLEAAVEFKKLGIVSWCVLSASTARICGDD